MHTQIPRPLHQPSPGVPKKITAPSQGCKTGQKYPRRRFQSISTGVLLGANLDTSAEHRSVRAEKPSNKGGNNGSNGGNGGNGGDGDNDENPWIQFQGLCTKMDYSNNSDFQKCVETIRAIGGDGKLCKCLNGIVQALLELVDAVRNAVETHALQVVKLKIERATCCLPPLSARVINRQSMDGPAIKKYTKAEACLEAQKHISGKESYSTYFQYSNETTPKNNGHDVRPLPAPHIIIRHARSSQQLGSVFRLLIQDKGRVHGNEHG